MGPRVMEPLYPLCQLLCLIVVLLQQILNRLEKHIVHAWLVIVVLYLHQFILEFLRKIDRQLDSFIVCSRSSDPSSRCYGFCFYRCLCRLYNFLYRILGRCSRFWNTDGYRRRLLLNEILYNALCHNSLSLMLYTTFYSCSALISISLAASLYSFAPLPSGSCVNMSLCIDADWFSFVFFLIYGLMTYAPNSSSMRPI